MILSVQVSIQLTASYGCFFQSMFYKFFVLILFFVELCSQNFLCSFWQSSHRSFQDDDYQEVRVFTCSLLFSCKARSTSSSYPIVTNSGDRFCLPDPFKRVPCRPACPARRKYCHGRCVYGGKACFFGPCSCSPYREDPGSTCSQLAIEAQEDECSSQCVDISSSNGAANCQSCLVENIPYVCEDLQGSSCWFCSLSTLEQWRQCSNDHQNSTAIINCIDEQLLSSCRMCICKLLCYWEAEGDLCKTCLEQPQLASLFVNHQYCPQGWVYSPQTSKCYKESLKNYALNDPFSFHINF